MVERTPADGRPDPDGTPGPDGADPEGAGARLVGPIGTTPPDRLALREADRPMSMPPVGDTCGAPDAGPLPDGPAGEGPLIPGPDAGGTGAPEREAPLTPGREADGAPLPEGRPG